MVSKLDDCVPIWPQSNVEKAERVEMAGGVEVGEAVWSWRGRQAARPTGFRYQMTSELLIIANELAPTMADAQLRII